MPISIWLPKGVQSAHTIIPARFAYQSSAFILKRESTDPFTEKFIQASEAMVVGDPLDERVDVGPMIDPG